MRTSATDTTSLVTALLAENKRPTKAQEGEIRKAIPHLKEVVSKAQRKFNDVDISLAILPPDQTPDARLTAQLAKLTLKLDAAKDQLANHMSSIAFGRQVPVEVLEIIFRMCLPETKYVVPDSRAAPLVLCHVCSAWRRVALLTPSLWCSLSLNLERRPGAWKAFLEGWLGRSGRLPLSLSIESSHGVRVYQYFNDHIAKLLLKDAKRWRRLRLDIPSSSLTKLLNVSLPLLESLEISARDRFPGVFISGADAPRLKRITLLDEVDPSYMNAPWGHLTHFHAAKHPFTLEKCFTLLAKCKHLTHCTVQISPTPTPGQQTTAPVLERLRSLVVIGAICQNSVTEFFAVMVQKLPSLESLELVNVEKEVFFRPFSPLFQLGQHSNLTRLRLVGGKPLVRLIDAVAEMSTLTELQLERRYGDKSMQPVPRDVQEALDMRVAHR